MESSRDELEGALQSTGLPILGWFVVATVVVMVLRLPSIADYLFEWDSVQFALATRRFDIAAHQPHPFGYPLWVLVLKALVKVIRDPNLAQILMAQMFAGGALAALLQVGRRCFGLWTGLLASVLLLFSPVVIVYTCVASTYTVDMLTSSLIGLLSWRLWKGEKSLGPVAAAAWAVCAGFRSSGAVFMAPLLLVALIRSLRGDWRAWCGTVVAGGTIYALWYSQILAAGGGPNAESRFYWETFAPHSILLGAPWRAYLEMVATVTVWLATAAIVPLTVAGAARLMGGGSPAGEGVPYPAGYFALWTLPGLGFSYLIMCGRSAHLLIALPPILLLLSAVIVQGLTRWCGARGWKPSVVVVSAALACALGGTLIAACPYDRLSGLHLSPAFLRPLEESSLQAIRASDSQMRTIVSLVRYDNSMPPEQAHLVVFDVPTAAANFRKLSWYLPELPVTWLTGRMESMNRQARVVSEVHLRAGVRRIWWVTAYVESLPPSVVKAWPATRMVWRDTDAGLILWASDIGGERVDVAVPGGNSRIRFHR